MNEGKLFNSQRITLVTNIAKLFAGSGLEELANEQIGIFAQDGRSRFKGTRTPEHAKNRKFKIAQGFPNKYSELTKRAQLPAWPHETVEFSAKQIVGWSGVRAQKATGEEVVALGYDGVDTAKGLQVKKGQGFKFWLHLTGSPISKLVPTTGWLRREYFIEPDCTADSEPSDYHSELLIRDKMIRAINNDKFGTIPISTFVKATPISSAQGSEAISGLTSFVTYNVTVVDSGKDGDLGIVQSQYPGFNVIRTDRTGLVSTYSLVKTSGLPTALSLSRFPVLPNCTSCPSGYTLQTQGAVFEVTVASDKVPADVTGQLSKTKITDDAAQVVYQFVMPAATVPATFTAAVVADRPEAEVLFVGVQSGLCTPPAATTTAWTAGTTVKKAPRVYTITVGDTICGTSRLAELQAIYGSGVSETTTGTCARTYSLTVYSDAVADDNCGLTQYKWTAPDPFEGAVWLAAAVTRPTGLKGGILLEGARFDQNITAETYLYKGFDSRDQDCVHIRASSFEQSYDGAVCQTPFPFTQLRDADYNIGSGREVIEYELDSLGYFLKGPYAVHPVVRELYGAKFIADPQGFYDQYLLKITKSNLNAGFFDSTDFTITYRFFFPVGLGKEFETAINQLVLSADMDLAEVNL